MREIGTVIALCLVGLLCGIGASAQQPVIVRIGFTESESGAYESLSQRQADGLRLWIADINASGGIELLDGTFLVFQTVSYDDESSNDRVIEGYTKLILNDQVSFLVSPYSSSAAAAAATVADSYGRILITAGAASESAHMKGYTHVYQVYSPSAAYLAGAVDLLASLLPPSAPIAFVVEDSSFARGAADTAKANAEDLGYTAVLDSLYAVGETDFASTVVALRAAEALAVIGGGHFDDGAALAGAIHDADLGIQFMALLVAPADPGFASVRDAAIGVIGPSQWEPEADYSPASATTLGIDWAGPTGTDFVQAYVAAYGQEPSYHSAGGYAAGLVLEQAIRAANSVDTIEVQAALDALDLMTFFGRLRFDTSPERHGLQIGHDMVLVQWQLDERGGFVKQVVWPDSAATASPLYPIP